MSIVGAVVMISGAKIWLGRKCARGVHGTYVEGQEGHQHQLELAVGLEIMSALENNTTTNQTNLHIPLVANWESEACRNFNMLKRRCFWLSSCIGGDTVRVRDLEALSAGVLAADGPSDAASGDRNSAAESRRGICSLALLSTAGTGKVFEESAE